MHGPMNSKPKVDSEAWHTAGHELVAYAGRFGHLESARFLLQAGVDSWSLSGILLFGVYSGFRV